MENDKPNFTLGPWEATRNVIRAKIFDSVENQPLYPLIAVVADTTTSAKDNARLIAAAPLMYEALEALSEAIESCPEFVDAMKSFGFDVDVVDTLRDAKKVLKMARGIKC